ncbi:MAG: hypothetical protein AAF682_15430 [Planctomycetota bacterium]
MPWEKRSRDLHRPEGPGDDPLASNAPGEAEALDIAILREPDPRVRLNRLIDEDPFGVTARVSRRIRERALFVNPVQSTLHTMGRLAIAAGRLASGTRGPDGRVSIDGPIDAWVEAAIDITLDSMVEGQREEESRGRPYAAVDARYYAELARAVQVAPGEGRLVCVALNDLGEATRRTFHGIVVQGIAVDDWADRNGTRPKQVHRVLQEVSWEVLGALKEARRRKRRPRR